MYPPKNSSQIPQNYSGRMATASKQVHMEYIFARDIVNVLVLRKVKNFELEDDNHQHPTPFCFRIRRAVEHYVTKEDLDIYHAVADYRSIVPDYKALIAYQKVMILPSVKNLASLLKHMSILGMMAGWHRKWGDETAPELAVEEIQRILVVFAWRYEHPDIFWGSLKAAAPYITNRPLSAEEKEFQSSWKL